MKGLTIQSNAISTNYYGHLHSKRKKQKTKTNKKLGVGGLPDGEKPWPNKQIPRQHYWNGNIQPLEHLDRSQMSF